MKKNNSKYKKQFARQFLFELLFGKYLIAIPSELMYFPMKIFQREW